MGWAARRQDIITYLTTGARSDSSLTVRYNPAWFRSLSLAMPYIAWAILVSVVASLWWAFGNIRRTLTVLAVLGSIFLILDIL